jgi:hypothetical protein
MITEFGIRANIRKHKSPFQFLTIGWLIAFVPTFKVPRPMGMRYAPRALSFWDPPYNQLRRFSILALPYPIAGKGIFDVASIEKSK